MSETPRKEHTLKTGERLTVRTAAPDDAQAILELAHIILAEDLYNIRTLEEFKMTVEAEREWIQKHVDEPGQIILLAELNGDIVGMLGFENSSRKRLAHRGTLHMSVHPQHRRNGIGTALLQSLLEWAQENPVIEKVKLAVFATNRPAVSLYRKMGFLKEGRRTKEIKIAEGKYVDEILMYRLVKD
ncbi:MAG: GNAT family N-acetyltransferase [Planctomycetota bacterium]|jgi:RimJ/RimL family protein N-acetyltransferase